MKVGVARETAPGERRVALVPEVLGKLTAAGLEVLVEAGAGAGAAIPDSAFAEAGARIVSTAELYAQSDVILKVQKPSEAEVAQLRQGQAVVGFLQPLIDPALAAALAARGVTAISLDALPRTLSRAQSMDALSSQANVGGYKAVLIAATAFGRYFPLLTTAAGTAKPANVLVLGIGVAGLQAIGTARRLGAVVKAYDVRSETKEQAQSLGAQFLVLKSLGDASGSGGYARELTAEERAAQQAELNGYIGAMDVVITTAQVPGRRPPVLVTAEAVGLMKSGSVIVDMAASALGGNCELSRVGETIVTDNGVTIIAPDNLPATMPAGSSAFYARNISALLLHFVKEGAMNYDLDEEITAGTVITHGGAVVQAATRKLLDPPPAAPAASDEAQWGHRLEQAGRRMSQELLNALALFVLAILVGFEVISKVPATLHTPLMSGANSIHGIVLVGAMLIAAEADNPFTYLLAFVAMVFGAMNVVGGYVVTDRMLQMFRKKAPPPKPASDQTEGQA